MDLGFSFPADENLQDESEVAFRLEQETGVRGLEDLMEASKVADPPLRSRSRRADGADMGGVELP